MLSSIGGVSSASSRTQIPLLHVLVEGSEEEEEEGEEEGEDKEEDEVGSRRLESLGIEDLCDEVDSWSSGLTYIIDNKDTKKSQQVCVVFMCKVERMIDVGDNESILLVCNEEVSGTSVNVGAMHADYN